jgi:MSP (Major sperm protein) domain
MTTTAAVTLRSAKNGIRCVVEQKVLDFHEQDTQTLTVINLFDTPLQFRVQNTNKQAYAVLPPTGTVNPGKRFRMYVCSSE